MHLLLEFRPLRPTSQGWLIMTPYLALLFCAATAGTLGRHYGGDGVKRLNLLFVAGLLIFFAGFRHRAVGTDTGTYVSWLTRVTSFEEALEFQTEIGYNLLIWFSSSLSDSYALLLVVIGVLVVGCYLTTIASLVKNYEFAIFVFISLGVYTFFFNAARQGIAVALCFAALPWLLKREAIPYFLLIAVAVLFHKTAIIAAPLYFVARPNVGLKDIVMVVLGTAIVAASISSLAQLVASFLDDRFASYGEEGSGGGHVQVAFLAVQGMLLLLFKGQVKEHRDWYNRLLNIYLLGLIPAFASIVASVNPSGILRLTAYFSHASIVLWPMVLLSYSRVRNRTIFLLGFLVCAVVYYVLTTSNFSGLYPYRLNSSLFL